MYNLPQEIEVWYIIPAIRKEFAKVLIKKHGLTFEKTGNILGVSKAAISQYLKKKRANITKIPENIKKEIKISAEKIVKDENSAVKEIIRILNLMKNSGCECNVCRRYNKGVLKLCKGRRVRGE